MQTAMVKEIIERHHKALYHPTKAKAARGYPVAALKEIGALYTPGTVDHDRIQKLFNTAPQIHSFAHKHFQDGTLRRHFLFFLVVAEYSSALLIHFCQQRIVHLLILFLAGFPHAKEAEESQKKKADAAAAKTQHVNELGIGAPGLNALAVTINAWIEQFKSTRMESSAGGITKFKSGVTKETVNGLVERVNLWITAHQCTSSKPRWSTFKAELYVAYEETFVC